MRGDDWDEETRTLKGSVAHADSEDGAESLSNGDEDLLPESVSRRCTDASCLLVFLLLMSAVVCTVSFYAAARGNLNRLLAFRDENHALCEKYLFFCQTGEETLDMFRPICVDECPDKVTRNTSRCHGDQEYPTNEYLFQLCRPSKSDKALYRAVRHYTDVARGRIAFRSTLRHVPTLGGCAAMAVISSYAQLYFLYKSAPWLLKAGIFLLCSVPLGIGIIRTGLLTYIPIVKLVAPAPPPTGHGARIMGAVILLVGLAFGGIGCAMRRSIHKAIDCFEMSFVCILQTRMFLHPLAIALLHASLCGFLAWGSALLLSCHSEMGSSHGVRPLIAALFFLMWGWAGQSIFMFSEFVLDFVTATWCFQGGLRGDGQISRRTACRAYAKALRYHLGTCVYAGLVVGLLRPVQMTLGKLVHFCSLKANPMQCFLHCGCEDLVEEFETYISPLNKNAMNEVVLNGRSFCTAARQAQATMHRQQDAVKILNGATLILQVCMVTLNAFLGAIFMSLNVGWQQARTVTNDLAFADDDLGMSWEIVYLICGGALIAGLVTLPFVLLIDSVSDAILYCIEIHEQRERAAKDWLDSQFEAIPCVPCVYRGLTPSPISNLISASFVGSGTASPEAGLDGDDDSFEAEP